MILTIVLFGAAALGVTIFLLASPQRFEVARSLHIQVPAQEIFDKLRGLESWAEWSPWLIYEPDCALEYSETRGEEGSWCSWNGKKIGAGKLQLVELLKPNCIEAKLHFLRPHKATNAVSFRMENSGVGTVLHWKMQGSLPLLLKLMIPRIVAMLSNDFDIGLLRLKAILDPGSDGMNLALLEPVELPAQDYAAKHFDAATEDLPDVMPQGFRDLDEALRTNQVKAAARPFTAIFRSYDNGKRFEGDMGVPVVGQQTSTAFTVRRLPGGRYLPLRYRGSYDHLTLAWHCAFANLNMRKAKLDPSLPWLEVYENSPTEIGDPVQLRTLIYLPIKD